MSTTDSEPLAGPASTPKASAYKRFSAWVISLSETRYALWAMLLVSVIDGSIFPIPPFALLVPMVFAEPKRWWKLALWGTLASLVGGVIGYGLGKFAGTWVTEVLGVNLNVRIQRFGIDSTVAELLGDNFWILALLASVLPSPFKIVAIGSGMVGVAFPRFMLAAIIGRTVRFFLVAGAMRFVGPTARKWLRV